MLESGCHCGNCCIQVEAFPKAALTFQHSESILQVHAAFIFNNRLYITGPAMSIHAGSLHKGQVTKIDLESLFIHAPFCISRSATQTKKNRNKISKKKLHMNPALGMVYCWDWKYSVQFIDVCLMICLMKDHFIFPISKLFAGFNGYYQLSFWLARMPIPTNQIFNNPELKRRIVSSRSKRLHHI